jgi:hypothetical protein
MKKELKDYLHLYMTYNERILFIEKSNYYFVHEHSIHKGDSVLLMPHIIAALDLHGEGVEVKLILRPLESMTEDELIETLSIFEPVMEFEEDMIKGGLKSVREEGIKSMMGNEDYDMSKYAQLIHLLLSKHFDIFGLIEAGLAIEKK